jgi:hypothetical protein
VEGIHAQADSIDVEQREPRYKPRYKPRRRIRTPDLETAMGERGRLIAHFERWYFSMMYFSWNVELKLWSKRVAYGLVLKYVFETRCRSYTIVQDVLHKMQV